MFNNEELEDLKFMIEKGFTQSQAAQVLGKSVLEVRACIKTHGIFSPLKDKEKDGLFFCKKCSTYKTKQEFDNYKKSKHGISTHCKVCRSENYKLLRQKKCFAEIDALIEKSKENEKTLTLEERFAHLEQIVARMEDADVSLDEAFELYKKGLDEVKSANDMVQGMEKAMLVLNSDGQLEEF